MVGRVVAPRLSCTEPGCEDPWERRGLCSAHYQWRWAHGTLPAAPPERACEQCETVFQPIRWGTSYCSTKCIERTRYLRRRPAPHSHTCEQCGASLEGRNRRTRFCDRKCSNDFHNAARSAARWAEIEANRKPCRGCLGKIPAGLSSLAEYCSDECKIRSRRHEAYGLTAEGLAQLLAQNEQCAICKTDQWGPKGPAVDHCHSCGRVRKVLCMGCNVGLGAFGDDPERLEAAAAYLREHIALAG